MTRVELSEMAKKCSIAVLVLLLNVLLGCEGPDEVPHEPAPPSEAEGRLLEYIQTGQPGEHGVYTNRLDTDQRDVLASGHEVLSESAGGILSDSGFLLFIILCFAGILFVSGQQTHIMQHIILLNIAFMIAILAYFIHVTAGLILNILFLFGYGTYTLYQTLAIGDAVAPGAYFWLLMTPLYTAAVWLFSLGLKRLQADNDALREANGRLATIDQGTNLRNALIF